MEIIRCTACGQPCPDPTVIKAADAELTLCRRCMENLRAGLDGQGPDQRPWHYGPSYVHVFNKTATDGKKNPYLQDMQDQPDGIENPYRPDMSKQSDGIKNPYLQDMQNQPGTPVEKPAKRDNATAQNIPSDTDVFAWITANADKNVLIRFCEQVLRRIRDLDLDDF